MSQASIRPNLELDRKTLKKKKMNQFFKTMVSDSVSVGRKRKDYTFLGGGLQRNGKQSTRGKDNQWETRDKTEGATHIHHA